MPRTRSAGAGRHGIDREVRNPGRAVQEARRSRIRSSTPAITSRKPISSPRPAGPAPSPSRPTWRAAAPTFSSAAISTCGCARKRRPSSIRRSAPRRTTAIRAEIAARTTSRSKAGGLFVIGSERHESRRIDNQLRGRSGRQGDPGASKFFVSLEDDLMRIFGSERMDGMLQKLGLKEGEAIIHPWINKALEKAQEKVEARNYEIRKTSAAIRRRDERPAQGHLRAAPRDHERDRCCGDDRRHAPRDGRAHGRALRARELAARSMGHRLGSMPRSGRLLNLDLPVADWAKEEGIAEDEYPRAVDRGGRHQDGRRRPRITAPN